MPDKADIKEQLKGITSRIEASIQELFESKKYQQYLRTMSRFHKYSVNNTMLIYMQKPDATLVAGFNKWRDQFGRSVMKGEKGIKIIAPTPYKRKIEEVKLDPESKVPLLDENGEMIIEEKEVRIPMYKPVTVFDVSQTVGKPLPQLASDLTGNVQNYDIFLEALKRSSPVPIHMEIIDSGMDGYFDSEKQNIAIREGMSEVQTVSSIIHEITHSKLHNEKLYGSLDTELTFEEAELFENPALFIHTKVAAEKIPNGLFRYELRGSRDEPKLPIAIEEAVATNYAGTVITAQALELTGGSIPLADGLKLLGGEKTIKAFYEQVHPEAIKKSQNTEEVEAESVSYAICAYYGIETGKNSFGYIAAWSKNKDLPELRASLETINKTASVLIPDIDRHYLEIMKERGVELPKKADYKHVAKLTEEVKDRIYLINEIQYLHVQTANEGFYYALYDRETLKKIDGGQIEPLENAETYEANGVSLSAARDRILMLHEIKPESVTSLPPNIVKELLESIDAANTVHIADEEPIQQIAIQAPVSAPDNIAVPDPAVSVECMKSYGYTADAMLPLTQNTALELMEHGVTIYVLCPDNTEAMVFDEKEIQEFDGIFGVDTSEWDRVKDVITLETTSQNYETAFLFNPADAFAIYQVKEGDEYSDFRFESMEYLRKNGLSVGRENYSAVYTADLSISGDTYEKLDRLYTQFNIDRPENFTGRSMSTSDVIALKQYGIVSCHYVEPWGFKELPGFIQTENHLKNAEMSIEDDYSMIDGVINNGRHPSVAELEEQAKTGNPISLLELSQAIQRENPKQQQLRRAESTEKSSILVKLRTPADRDRSEKSVLKRNTERTL